ncbi:MAG TPA: hypothetical protein VFE46_02300 [Pirellulales bacterium]|jgi:hypothetical protein|nr:hypothetical protein [Pirellulales bacterium]
MNRSRKLLFFQRWAEITPLVLALAALAWVIACAAPRAAQAASPWDTLLPFKKIDAAQGNSYPIAQANGPWMILAYTFRGDKSSEQAQQLVYELRSKNRLPAYSYERTFDFTKPERGLGFNPDGTPKMMHYQQGGVIKETAVLVGNFDTVDDPAAQSMLKKIKKLQPASIHPDQMFPAGDGPQSGDSSKTAPMRLAMVVTNPLLPKEYFSGKGVDKLVLDMNKDVPNCLLDCPGRFSICIATFTGSVVIDQKKIAEAEKGKSIPDHLVEAAEKAHRLAAWLHSNQFGNRMWDAYEFHDRDRSIVCVGSFEQLGTVGADGKLVLDPRVQEIVNTFGNNQALTVGAMQPTGKAIDVNYPAGTPASVRKAPDLILLDLAPKPIEVPRRSISADYQRAMHAKL